MNQQKWERDILNRQRNIVFPDTMLNEGRFYRNIASGEAIFTFGLKLSVATFTVFQAMMGAMALVSVFVEPLGTSNIFNLWAVIYILFWVVFWTFLAINVFIPAKPVARKRRRGYRSSGRS